MQKTRETEGKKVQTKLENEKIKAKEINIAMKDRQAVEKIWTREIERQDRKQMIKWRYGGRSETEENVKDENVKTRDKGQEGR